MNSSQELLAIYQISMENICKSLLFQDKDLPRINYKLNFNLSKLNKQFVWFVQHSFIMKAISTKQVV